MNREPMFVAIRTAREPQGLEFSVVPSRVQVRRGVSGQKKSPVVGDRSFYGGM